MSSKILPRDKPLQAPGFQWRFVGSGDSVVRGSSEGASLKTAATLSVGSHGQGASPTQNTAAAQSQQGQDAHKPSTPSGPSWEQYRELEVRLRELEQQVPLREQQARQAATRDAETASTARWEGALEKLSRAITDIASYRTRLRREAEQDVVKLSLAIARRVLHREVAMDRDALLGLIRTAFEKLEAREIHRVRLRPEDVALVSAYLERLGTPNRVEVQGDATLERGGAIVDTQRGSLDISLDTQLAEIERGFTDLLGKRTSA